MTEQDIISIITNDPRAAEVEYARARSTIAVAIGRRSIAHFWAKLAEEELSIAFGKFPGRPERAFPTAAERAALLEFQVGLIRVASDVEQAFQWLESLNPAEKFNIENSIQGHERVAMLREVGKRNPIIEAWYERSDERERKIKYAHARAVADERAAWEAGAPQRALDAIEAAGAVLTVSKGGDIMGTNTSAVTPEMTENLRQHKAEVISILAARAAARAPIYLA